MQLSSFTEACAHCPVGGEESRGQSKAVVGCLPWIKTQTQNLGFSIEPQVEPLPRTKDKPS